MQGVIMSFEHLEEEAYRLSFIYPRLSTCLLMRKFKINYETAKSLRGKVFLRNHLEARRMAKDMENI